MSRRKRRKKNNLKKIVIALAAAVVVVAAAIGIFQFKSPLQALLTPGKVEGVTANVCYSQVGLKWDAAKKAKGYKILERTDDGDETLGYTNGDTKFTIKDYDNEKEHEYIVEAIRKDPFNDTEYTGEPSDPVEAYYDKSKYAQKVPVLAYHAVISSQEEANSSLIIVESAFDEQMKYLHDNGYKTLTLDEFRQWYLGKKELPKKAVLITFDDGDYGVYHFAYPIIKKYNQAATSFIIGHHVGETTDDYVADITQNHYIGWDVIQKVRKEYPKFEFESHTYDMHQRVNGKVPAKGFTYEQIVEDTKANDRFGFSYLAYPWGTHTEKMQKALKDCGYKMAFAYRPFYYATRNNDPFAIDRIKIRGAIPLEKFIRIVSGENEKYDNPDDPDNADNADNAEE